ncbi:hypothetical protein ACQU0X_27975 [Pseudovibrio ascidiaceicola]|uniref:hypothetical protein n=1 Tax=Pseudovibrio ascidiaceicola TaxID=285279 RepID=UPI003D35A386
MTYKINASETVAGDVLAYLMEAAAQHDPEYTDEALLKDCSALTLRDGGELVLAAAYQIHERGNGRELTVIMANGSKAKFMKWLPVMKDAFVEMARFENCDRVLVSVSRPAMERALSALDFGPVATLMRFMV